MNGTLWVHEVARLAVLKKMVLPSVVMPERKYKLQELFEEGYTFICSPFFSTDPPDYFSPDGSLFAQHLSFAKRGRAYPVELHHKESINKPNPPLVLSLEESFHEFADRILTTFIERGFFNSFPGMPEIYASKSVFKVVNYAKRHGPLDLEYSEATCSLLFGYKKYIKHLLSNEGGASFEKHESRYSYAERCYYAEYAQWTRSLDFLSTEAGDSAEITSLKIRHLPNYPPCGSEKVYLRNLSIDPNPLSSSEKVDARVILRNSRKEGSKLVIPSLPPEAQDLLEELYSKMSYLPEMPIRDAVKQHIIDTSLNVSPKYLQPISRKFRSFLLDDIVVIDNRLTVPFCLEPNVEEGLKAQGYISTD